MGSSELAKGLRDIVGENDSHLGADMWIDSGLPELNWALCGNYFDGFASEGITEIFGPAASGKTFLATMAMIAAQRAGGVCGFSDHERTFNKVLAQSLGLKTTSDDGFVYKRPVTFEESINHCISTAKLVRERELIPKDAPMVWVFDSLASMVPYEKLYDKDGKSRLGKDVKVNMRDKLSLATCTSQHFPTLSQFAADNNMLVLMLNQIRVDPGVMYGNPNKTPGGNAPEFYSGNRLSIGKKDIVNDKKEVIGSRITCKTLKCKFARFGRTAEWDIFFLPDRGAMVDHIGSNVDFILRRELLPRSGTYYEWEGKKYQKKTLVDRMRDDADEYARLLQILPDTRVEST